MDIREEFDKVIRKTYFKEYPSVCARCGTTKDIELHHKKEIALGGDNSFNNLAPLCGRCHKEYHKNDFFDFDFFLTTKTIEMQFVEVIVKNVIKNMDNKVPINIDDLVKAIYNDNIDKFDLLRKTNKRAQAEGIAVAKAQGKHLGRPRATFPNNFEEEYLKWKRGEQTAVATWGHLGLTKTTFYKLVKQYEAGKDE